MRKFIKLSQTKFYLKLGKNWRELKKLVFEVDVCDRSLTHLNSDSLATPALNIIYLKTLKHSTKNRLLQHEHQIKTTFSPTKNKLKTWEEKIFVFPTIYVMKIHFPKYFSPKFNTIIWIMYAFNIIPVLYFCISIQFLLDFNKISSLYIPNSIS